MPATNGRSPVMADVARLAGVSHQTVSRVLNGHPNVKAETRTRVEMAIGELGYRRNSSARALVTRRTSVIGVVAFDPTLYGPASTLGGIERAARASGYFLSVVTLQTVTRQAVREAMDYLAQQSVEGYIVVAPLRTVVDGLVDLPYGRPVVAVEGGEAPDLPVVCVDQPGGAYLATRHLLDLGHRTVHHITGPSDWLEAEGRVAGWRLALEEAGAPVHEPLSGDWRPRAGYELGRRLADGNEATAIFVANDQMALGALRALGEAGVRVPGDVSVVGFDDVPEAEFFAPPLTTVAQDFNEVGQRSIALLVSLLEASGGPGAQPIRDVVPARLITRQSTANPPAS
ncbi:DNA-binding LacI/PurR family transcriptional regulator [Lipingzhangella halophila]|uniref:DNA-binding LacI/PurR family transcriptional regulator n=1 Tax=Lipingzhangella halophila TaxID=1783352 RepID=A0A7W7REH0_9ACTN|nr:LacI family DNA-binding transcriptional regulator [Lipingzhangella halophila]MBB4930350.1 DNA-binding LacI/PurR family transcriptional regulator [Lipingzhangella halophila]